jgi:hypothetical protein
MRLYDEETMTRLLSSKTATMTSDTFEVWWCPLSTQMKLKPSAFISKLFTSLALCNEQKITLLL